MDFRSTLKGVSGVEMGRLTAEPGVYYPDEVRDQLRTSRSLDRGVQPCGAVHVGGRADDGFWEGFGEQVEELLERQRRGALGLFL